MTPGDMIATAFAYGGGAILIGMWIGRRLKRCREQTTYASATDPVNFAPETTLGGPKGAGSRSS